MLELSNTIKANCVSHPVELQIPSVLIPNSQPHQCKPCLIPDPVVICINSVSELRAHVTLNDQDPRIAAATAGTNGDPSGLFRERKEVPLSCGLDWYTLHGPTWGGETMDGKDHGWNKLFFDGFWRFRFTCTLSKDHVWRVHFTNT